MFTHTDAHTYLEGSIRDGPGTVADQAASVAPTAA